MTEISDQLIITTDDGSKGIKGLVTAALKEELEKTKIDMVMGVGPAIMMKFVCETTGPFNTNTIVSLNSIMVDGTGMCGACRVSVGDEQKFACVDGPDFDGHLVDWDLLMSRQRAYVTQEKESFDEWKKRHEEMNGGEKLIVE